MNNDYNLDGGLAVAAPELNTSGASNWNRLAVEVQDLIVSGRFPEAYSVFSNLRRGTAERVLRSVRAKIGNEADAKDVVAQIYLELFGALKKPEPIGNVVALISRIAKLRVIDFWRKRSGTGARARTLKGEWLEKEVTQDDLFWDKYGSGSAAEMDESGAVDDRLFADVMVVIVRERLRPELWAVLEKRHMDELSVYETATALGITEHVVKKRCKDAIAQAREIIKQETRI